MSECRIHLPFQCGFFCKTCNVQVCNYCLDSPPYHVEHDISSIEFKYEEAQGFKVCGSCENPVRYYCSTCHFGICDDCVSSHLRISQKRHNVIEYKRKDYCDSVDILCQTHNSKCALYCKNCKIPICGKCIQQHKSHQNVSLADLNAENIDMLLTKLHNLKTIIKPAYEKLYTPEAKLSTLKDTIKKHGERMHQKIDESVTDMVNAVTAIEKMHFKQLGILQRRLKATNKLIKKYEEILKDPLVLQNPNLFPDLSEYEFLNTVSENYDFSMLSFKPSDLVDSSILVGYLCNTNMLPNDSYKIVQQIIDNPTLEFSVSCGSHVNHLICHIQDLWICSGYRKDIRQIDSDGKIKTTVKTKMIPQYFLKTQSNDLEFLYTTDTGDCIWKKSHGKEYSFVKLDDSLEVRGMALTRSNEIFVCLYNFYKRSGMVERYRQDGMHIQTMEYNTEGQILFQSPMSVTENYDGNVCVTDYENQSVVGVNKYCFQRFLYKGFSRSDSEQHFRPVGIVTDRQCHILISDENNNVIHMLNSNGKFLRYLATELLFRPGSLSLDSKERLWIGNENGIICVLKYLKG